MPGQDGTGPLGQGPLTGRGLGPCGRGLARGFRRGFGRGFAWRARVMPVQPAIQPEIIQPQAIPIQQIAQPQVITEAEEKEILKQELEAIKAEQAEIEKRLKELKA